MLKKPVGAFDLALQKRAIERVLEVTGSELRDGLDDLEAAEVGRVAHGRPPVSVADRQVEQGRVGLKDANDLVAGVRANGLVQLMGQNVRFDPMLQLPPTGEPVLTGNHELGIGELEFGPRDGRILQGLELRVSPANPVERLGLRRAPFLEKLAGFALGHIQMRPLGQVA